MAYIRLRISDREFELEGTEEFIARMENKIMAFLESPTGRQSAGRQSAKNYPKNPTSDLQTFGRSEDTNYQTGIHSEPNDIYVRAFMEKYNSFNSTVSSNKD